MVVGNAGASRAKPFVRKLKTSKQKWAYYFSRERQVLDVIRDHLAQTSNRVFTEHDGFRTERQVDLDQLTREIHEKTGVKLAIQCNEQRVQLCGSLLSPQ